MPGDAGYLAVQPDWLSAQWELMEQQVRSNSSSVLHLHLTVLTTIQPWFRGKMSRAQATAELENKPAGTFVVRVSSEPGMCPIVVNL